jgi:hypothetical protein
MGVLKLYVQASLPVYIDFGVPVSIHVHRDLLAGIASQVQCILTVSRECFVAVP